MYYFREVVTFDIFSLLIFVVVENVVKHNEFVYTRE